MTFGVAIKVREGIVALADTLVVRGSERFNKQKLSMIPHADHSLFAMTSGLRSVRDKALTYFGEHLQQAGTPVDRMHRAVTLFGDQLRRVRAEDGEALSQSRLTFNTHAILGGCLSADDTPQLFYVYPEGNWVEIAVDSPYFVVGRTTYGRPILDGLLTYETSLRSAIALALLAFDATRTSVTDVGFPIDVAVFAKGSRHATFHRYRESDIADVTQQWSQSLVDALNSLPMAWADVLLTPGKSKR